MSTKTLYFPLFNKDEKMQLGSQPYRGQATLGPVVVRAGSSKSYDVDGVLFPGVQVDVRGVGRFVVLVPKLVDERVQHGNQGVFLVVEHIANRAVWLVNPACIDRILPPCRTPNDPSDATPKALQIIKHEFLASWERRFQQTGLSSPITTKHCVRSVDQKAQPIIISCATDERPAGTCREDSQDSTF